MSDGDLDLALLLGIFKEQSEEGLTAMEESLVALEARPGDRDLLDTIFRTCHTLKGDGNTLGLSELSGFAHVLEDLLDELRRGAARMTPEIATLLLESVDALREMVRAAGSDQPVDAARHQRLVTRLQESALGAAPGATQPSAGGDLEELLEQRALVAPTLRVRVEVLDRLLDLVGEIAISRSHVGQMIESDAPLDRHALREAHRSLDVLYDDLQQEVMQVRMVPVGPLFRKHLRTVRDAALAHGRRVGLEIEGADVELDTTVVEHLRGALSHMIRNAIAHGIEPEDERRRNGKPAAGRILLRAFHEGPCIVVQVADDGAGLDRGAIFERASRLLPRSELERMGDAQLDQLIFEPGFSTADETTLAAGRGVGMDVVRRNIEALGGSIGIESTPGIGTTVTMRLPLTLAIIEGFTVRVGRETFVIPVSSVSECLDLGPSDARRPGQERGREAGGVIDLRGRALPTAPLRSLLRVPGEPPARQTVVVIRHEGEEAGLLVDEVLGERQAVIKPLGPLFAGLPGLAGSTILGDGRVALILDAPALLRVGAGWRSRPGGGPPGSLWAPRGAAGAPSGSGNQPG